jgi:hypothetical protein
VIQVGFDQPVQATSFFPDGSAKQSPTREPVWPTSRDSCFVVMFPGFLEQLDKVQPVDLDAVGGWPGSAVCSSFTAEHASMKLIR